MGRLRTPWNPSIKEDPIPDQPKNMPAPIIIFKHMLIAISTTYMTGLFLNIMECFHTSCFALSDTVEDQLFTSTPTSWTLWIYSLTITWTYNFNLKCINYAIKKFGDGKFASLAHLTSFHCHDWVDSIFKSVGIILSAIVLLDLNKPKLKEALSALTALLIVTYLGSENNSGNRIILSNSYMDSLITMVLILCVLHSETSSILFWVAYCGHFLRTPTYACSGMETVYEFLRRACAFRVFGRMVVGTGSYGIRYPVNHYS